MNLTRENKLDVLSGFLAVFGIVLMVVGSEFSNSLLMIVGAAIVILTAGVRFWFFRSARSRDHHLQSH